MFKPLYTPYKFKPNNNFEKYFFPYYVQIPDFLINNFKFIKNLHEFLSEASVIIEKYKDSKYESTVIIEHNLLSILFLSFTLKNKYYRWINEIY